MELPTQAWSAHCRRLTDERAAGWLSAAAYDALQALAALVAQGNPTPSVRQIAALAHVSSRTVQRARRGAEERGLLAVEARYEMVDHRPRQQENRYELRTPVEPVRPRPRRQGVMGREGRIQKVLSYPPKGAEQQIAALGLSAYQVANSAKIARERMIRLGFV